ncbi:acyl carrier protein, partial [Thermoactinomyces sp. CICC 10522]
MVMKLTNELEKTFGPLPKTLFFEYKTVDELTGYFLAHYREQLERTLGASPAVSAALPEPVAPVAKERKSGRGRKWRPAFRTVPAEKTPETADIAIIGLAGRYPGARNMREFWRNLQAGKDCITEVPKERRELWQYTEEQARGIWGGFLEEVDRFDPLFFHISPREAELMDPQERLF